MKHRPLLYLLAVILVGTGTWLIERPTEGPRDDAQVIVFFPKLDPLQVKKLRISHLLDTVTLEKNGDQWTVVSDTTPPVVADSWKVGAAILAIKELESQSLISRDAASSPQLQANEIGTHVQAFDASGQVVADIYIGKTGPDLVSSHVRREGENTVYLAKGYLASQYPVAADQWKQHEKVDLTKSHSASGTGASPSGQ